MRLPITHIRRCIPVILSQGFNQIFKLQPAILRQMFSEQTDSIQSRI